MNRFLLLPGIFVCASIVGCAPSNQSGGLGDLISPRHAVATLLDPSGKPAGSATFDATGNGVQVKVSVSGLQPGSHGMHIHENGSCTDTKDASGNTVKFGGAGAHYDPGASHKHGSPDMSPAQAHGGDLPMITVGTDGKGSASFYTSRVSLSGDNNVLNRALIVHAMPDDYKTDPSGNSGARERCGVIAQPSTDQ